MCKICIKSKIDIKAVEIADNLMKIINFIKNVSSSTSHQKTLSLHLSVIPRI